MDVPQLLCSLSLILLIPIGCSQATEDNSPMMQETETEDVLQPPLERRNLRGEAPDPESLQPIPFNVPATNPPKQHTSERQTYQPCSLQSMLIRVKDLGLGYRSAEQILFKYCSGSCADSRQNYNVALSFLQQNNRVRGISDPCCNPTHYENVAFLDDTHQWHEMEKLSASACGC